MIGSHVLMVKVKGDVAEIECEGETRRAISSRTLHPGQTATMLGVEGLTLHVAGSDRGGA